MFVAKHDPNDQVKEQFVHAWDESVGGSRAVSLYLQEIIELCSAHLDSPQWVLKHTSARTIADTITAVSASETKISKETGQVLWPALEKAQGGKTWEGKETVLKAFVKFVESARPYWESHPDVASAINKVGLLPLVRLDYHVWSMQPESRCVTFADIGSRLPYERPNGKMQSIANIL